jgi:hypothetical protein
VGDLTCGPSTCSPEPGADCLPTSSSDTPQLSLLNTTSTAAESCASEPQRDGSPACTCTREMSGCSIHPLTPAEWISSQRASLARTLAQPEIVLAFRKVREAASGPKSFASLALFDPASCSLRTSQQSFLSDLDSTSFSLTLPTWGSMRDGSVCELPMLERPIEGTDGGASLLPTPTMACATGGQTSRSGDRKGELLLTGYAKMFPTPTQGDSKSSGSRNTATSKANAGVSLTDFVRQDGGVGRLWPTPSANNWKGSSKDGQRRGQLTDPAMGVIPAGGSLNPTWVEWLMAFPLGYTVARAHESRRKKSSKKAGAEGDTDVGVLPVRLDGQVAEASPESQPCAASLDPVPAVSSQGAQVGADNLGPARSGEQVGESQQAAEVRMLRGDVHLQAGEGNDVQSVMRQYAGAAPSWWEVEPDLGRVAHGIPNRVDRLKALGNGQVPLQAALAWRILTA